MAYRVLLIEQAEHDISTIHHYIAAADSRAAADQVVAELEAACASLADLPSRGRVPTELRSLGVTGCREIRWKPYRILYRIEGSQVLVNCVLDGRRDVESLLRRRLLR